ncbi:MAG TPA: response regulator [Methylomirabilota bacterium]|jgi:CheY-like chemotaxis protein
MAMRQLRGSETAAGHLLIIDDEPAILGMLVDFFTEGGYTVATAHTGHEALGAIGRARPDVILLDVMLHEPSGVEVLERLHRVHPNVPVILVTGGSDVLLAQAAVGMGAFDYLTKPFNPCDLNRAVVAAKLYGHRRAAGRGREIESSHGQTNDLVLLRDLARRARSAAELLFVVSPQRPNLYDAIHRAFAAVERVEVVFDRRAARQENGAAGVDPASDRRRKSIDDDLSVLGWALVARG